MDAYHLAMAWVQGGGLNQVPELLTRLPLIGHFSQELMDRFTLAYGNVQDSILEGGIAVGGIVLSSVGGLTKNTIDRRRLGARCPLPRLSGRPEPTLISFARGWHGLSMGTGCGLSFLDRTGLERVGHDRFGSRVSRAHG